MSAVAPWLLGLDIGAQPPLRFTQFGDGKSNVTCLVEDAAGGRWVLRRPPAGPLLATAHDVAREHRILRALAPTDVPTPEVLAFTEDPEVTDAPLLLMTYVDGVVPDDAPAPLAAALVRALATVHTVDLRATGLDDLASHRPYAARQIKRWRRQWQAARTRDAPAVERLADRLERAMPEQQEVTLVHGDFHLRNVIASPGGEEIRAVLDWELCTLGEPLADLGGLLAYWPHHSLADLYAAHTGRDLGALPFWRALGLWKVAIICEGVRRRALDDERNAARTGIPAAHVVDDLVGEAHAVLFEAGL